MEIYNVGNNSVNLFLLKSATHNLLIDAGFPGTLHEAFIGDLLPENVALELNDHKLIEDWKNLRKSGAKKKFPSHYNSYEVENN